MFCREHIATRAGLALGLAAALALGLPSLARADELASLQEAAVSAADDAQAAREKVAELEELIAQNDARVAELEAELPAQRERCAAAMAAHYKMGKDGSSLLSLILASDDFNQFITTLEYLDRITRSHLGEIDRLAEMDRELTETRDRLANERQLAVVQAEEAEAAARSAEEAAELARQAALANAEAAQRAYEASLAQGQTPTGEAEDIAREQNAAPAPTTDGPQNSDQNESPAEQDSDSTPEPKPESEPEPESPSEPEPTNNASYTWVETSTYGIGDGLLYSATATGETVTPTSMGIAMKTMPLGTIVELSYNGRTCTAVVNDRGPYVGNRQIDLQPAVANALGFDGIGVVGYRVIG